MFLEYSVIIDITEWIIKCDNLNYTWMINFINNKQRLP